MLSRLIFGESLTTWHLLLEILISGAVVVISAMRLTRLADRLADEWRLGSAFVGMLLLATVTSLPEVVAGATSGFIGSVDMAFGAVYGSCAFNVLIIVIMNLISRDRGSVLRNAHSAQSLAASSGIILIALSLLAMTAVQKLDGRPGMQNGVELVACVAIGVAYFYCLKLSERVEKREMVVVDADTPVKRDPGLLVGIAVVSIMTIGSAWWLTQTGDVLAEHPIELIGRPLGKTFVGVCFLALATSLPEITTSVAAVRLSNLNMAFGNIFGSNMFNILVIPIVKGATLLSGDSVMMSGADFSAARNMPAGLLPIILMAVSVVAITYRTERRVFRLGFDSVLLLFIYVVGMVVVLGGAE